MSGVTAGHDLSRRCPVAVSPPGEVDPVASGRPRSARLPALDVLRGLAILGTLLTNIWIFSAAHNSDDVAVGKVGGEAGVAWQQHLSTALDLVTDGKWIGLLTIMFGIGLEIQRQAAIRRGDTWPGSYPWRAGLLVVEGLLNYIFVFEFDVLMGYGLTGLAVAAVMATGPRAQKVWLVVGVTVHLGVIGMLSMPAIWTSTAPDDAAGTAERTALEAAVGEIAADPASLTDAQLTAIAGRHGVDVDQLREIARSAASASGSAGTDSYWDMVGFRLENVVAGRGEIPIMFTMGLGLFLGAVVGSIRAPHPCGWSEGMTPRRDVSADRPMRPGSVGRRIEPTRAAHGEDDNVHTVAEGDVLPRDREDGESSVGCERIESRDVPWAAARGDRWSDDPGRRVAVGLAAVAAVLYTSWVGAALANPDLSPITSYVSELAANGQPFARLFRALDGMAGLAIAAACLAVLRGHRRDVPGRGLVESNADPRPQAEPMPSLRPAGDAHGATIVVGRPAADRRRRLAPFALLALFGLMTVVDSLSPLTCTPTADLVCRAAEQAGTLPLTHRIHEVTSSAAGALAASAMVWTWWLTRRNGPRPLRTFGAGAAVVHLVTLGWSLVEIAGWGVGLLGLAQRTSLLALAVWWLVLFAATRVDARP